MTKWTYLGGGKGTVRAIALKAARPRKQGERTR